MPTAKRLVLRFRRLTIERFSGYDVALFLQQLTEVADRGDYARVPIAEGLALPPTTASRHSGSAAARSP